MGNTEVITVTAGSSPTPGAGTKGSCRVIGTQTLRGGPRRTGTQTLRKGRCLAVADIGELEGCPRGCPEAGSGVARRSRGCSSGRAGLTRCCCSVNRSREQARPPARAFPTPPVPAGRTRLAERRTWGTLASQQKTAVGLELRDSSLANGTLVSFPDFRVEDRGGTKCTGLS